MAHFKSLCVNRLITGVICAAYNYLTVKHPALSLTFLFYYDVVFHLSLSGELGMALWKIKAKIIPRSTDFANWSCHWALQTVQSQQRATLLKVPYIQPNPGVQLWTGVRAFVILEVHKLLQRNAIINVQYGHSSLMFQQINWSDCSCSQEDSSPLSLNDFMYFYCF